MTTAHAGTDVIKFNNLGQDPVRKFTLQRKGNVIKYHDGTASRQVALHDTAATFAGVTNNRAEVWVPSAVTSITAAGGITALEPTMRVQGLGGPIDITADPQIAPGINGQIIIIIGASDVNTVRLDQGNGLDLQSGPAVLAAGVTIVLQYDSALLLWQEINRNSPTSEKTWAFKSRDASSGTNYIGGFYKFGGSADDFSPALNFGTANSAYGAHAFLVQEAGAGGGTDTVVRVSGTSITGAGVRTPGDTQDLTIDDAGAAGTYYETSKKWIGQIAFTHISGPLLLCNYGLTKYWDNNLNRFRIWGFEATWLGASNDSNPDIILRKHSATGWAYNAGAAPTPPPPIASMATDYSTENEIRNNEEGSYDRSDLSVAIDGSSGEGTIVELFTTTLKTYAIGNFMMRSSPD